MANKNLDTLEKKINSELKLKDDWLQNNELLLNCSKTSCLLFNKHPHVSINSKFSIHIDQTKFKHLGLLTDGKLKWSAHAQHLSL